jgi:outer membrane protein TolC
MNKWNALRRGAAAGLALSTGLLASGCVLAPRAAETERQAMERAGKPYALPREKRWMANDLPPLPAAPTWRQVLVRTLWANGGLEAAYFQWVAAVERIPQAGSYPNTNLSLSASYLFSPGNVKAWDRTTLSVQPDAMNNLALPNKVYQNAKVATDAAQAAGERFRAAKFDLQRRVLNAWMDYALTAEQVRLRRRDLALLTLLKETAEARVGTGASQQELLRAQVARATAADQVQKLQTQLARQRAGLNALMLREPDAPLAPPAHLPAPRPLNVVDSVLLQLAAANNPALEALAREVAGRADALELAKLQYLPDLNPMAAITGGLSQVLGVGISIPELRLPALRGAVAEARAQWRGAMARAAQAGADQGARVVAALVTVREAERTARLFQNQVRPAAERLVDTAHQAYANGTGSFAGLIDDERMVLEVRLLIAEARIEREKSLDDLEALLAMDIESLPSSPLSAPQPTTAPMSDGAEVSHVP